MEGRITWERVCRRWDGFCFTNEFVLSWVYYWVELLNALQVR